MKLIAAIYTAATAIVLGGCATNAPSSSTSAEVAGASIPQRGLPAQNLEIGECGLFLWSISGDSTFVFFSKANSNAAKMLIGDEEQDLTLTAATGDIFGQFTTQQTFRATRTDHVIELAVQPGENMIDGQRVGRGHLNVIDPNGWETTIPVSGARACVSQPAPSAVPLGS
ncbi:MAG: hypothetical protein AAF216_14910 [Pseudomonadota bacterium]